MDGRIILRWIFRKWDLVVWTRSCWFRIRTVSGTCEYGNELRVPSNAGNFLTSLKKPVSFSRRTLLHGVSKAFLSHYIGGLEL